MTISRMQSAANLHSRHDINTT